MLLSLWKCLYPCFDVYKVAAKPSPDKIFDSGATGTQLFHCFTLPLFDPLSNRILLNVLFSTAYNTLLYFSPLCTVLYNTVLYNTVLYVDVSWDNMAFSVPKTKVGLGTPSHRP